MKFKHLNFLEWIQISVTIFRDKRNKRQRFLGGKKAGLERQRYKEWMEMGVLKRSQVAFKDFGRRKEKRVDENQDQRVGLA